jgi:hypothetical protein
MLKCQVEIETCPYCQFPREIIAINFPLFRPVIALFVCTSCGSAAAEPTGSKVRNSARLRFWDRFPVPQARPDESASVMDGISEALSSKSTTVDPPRPRH